MNKIILIGLLFWVSISQAQSADEYISRIQNTFSKTNSFSSDLVYSQVTSGAKVFKISGEFFYKQKDKFLMKSDKIELISDGKSFWNYNKRQNRVVISNSSSSSTFRISTFILDFPNNCTSKLIANSGRFVIELIPNVNYNNIEKLILTADENYHVIMINIFDNAGSEYVLEFKDLIIDDILPEKIFNFVPNNSIETVDLR